MMDKIAYNDLYVLYIVEQKPMHQIAKELGVAIGTVYNYCKKYGIETRDQKETFTMQWRTLSDAHRQAISKRHKGKVVSTETRIKMSKSKKQGGIGHKKRRSDGYVAIYFPDHPCSTKDGYILEHVLVMECLIGRHLYDFEVVHHINRNKADNRKENLQLMTFKEHASLHMTERHRKKV